MSTAPVYFSSETPYGGRARRLSVSFGTEDPKPKPQYISASVMSTMSTSVTQTQTPTWKGTGESEVSHFLFIFYYLAVTALLPLAASARVAWRHWALSPSCANCRRNWHHQVNEVVIKLSICRGCLRRGRGEGRRRRSQGRWGRGCGSRSRRQRWGVVSAKPPHIVMPELSGAAV